MAELLEAYPLATLSPSLLLTALPSHPGFYYHAAATAMIKRREAAGDLIKVLERRSYHIDNALVNGE